MDDVCDVCGKPATSLAIDVRRWPNYYTRHWEAAPVGPKKRGCDEHPVSSDEYVVEEGVPSVPLNPE